MRPNHIILKNYRSYGDKEEILYLNGNTTRILMGKNGAGKTTFVDAMMWALFGKTASNVDQIVNRKTKKNTKVEFSFNIKTDEFCIIRYRNDEKYGDELFLFNNKNNITQTKKKDTQNLIQEIIGVSYNTIINSIIFSKETFKPFLSETPTKRLSVLDSILNLKPITLWNEEARKQLNDIKNLIDDSNKKIEKCQFGIETINNSKENYLNDLKEKKDKLENEKKENEKKIESLKKELEEFVSINIEEEKENNKKFKEFTEENEKIEKKILDEEKLLKDVDEDLKEFNNKRIRLSELEKIDVEKEIKEIEEYEKDKNNNEKIEKEIELLLLKMSDLKSINLEISALETDKEKIEKELEKLEKNICHTCGQSLNKEKTEELILTNKEKYSNIITKIKELEDKKEIKTNENEELNIKIEKLKKDKKELKNKPSSNKEELKKTKEIISSLKSDIKIKENIIENSNSDNKIINDRIKKLREEKKEIKIKVKYQDDFLNNISEKITKNNNEIESLKKDNKKIDKDLKELNKESNFIDNSNKKIDVLNKEIEKETKIKNKNDLKFKYFNFIFYLTSNKNDGMKKYIVNKMIPMFNEKINFYLPFFFENNIINIYFDKDLKETITIDGLEVSFNEFSSGEKMRLELAISISLFILVKMFFSSSIGFIIFDEILDMNIDDEGIKSVLNIIDGLSSENSIIVISHKDQYKNYFKNRVFIEKEKRGFSKIIQE